MADYKSLYFYLFGKLSDLHDEIEKIQTEAEERVIETEPMVLAIDAPPKKEKQPEGSPPAQNNKSP